MKSSQKLSKSLGKSSKSIKENLECSICMGDFEEGDIIRAFSCKCNFHKACIDDWLQKDKRNEDTDTKDDQMLCIYGHALVTKDSKKELEQIKLKMEK